MTGTTPFTVAPLAGEGVDETGAVMPEARLRFYRT